MKIKCIDWIGHMFKAGEFYDCKNGIITNHKGDTIPLEKYQSIFEVVEEAPIKEEYTNESLYNPGVTIPKIKANSTSDEEIELIAEDYKSQSKWDTAGFFQEVDNDERIMKYGKV